MTKQYVSRSHFMFVITAIALMTSVAHAGSGVSYEGKILKADGSPEEDASVQFKLQIRTGDTADCLMYEETKTVVMTGSAGNFSVTLNDGNGARTDSTGYTIERILSNANALPVMAFSSGCTGGSETFTPAANAGRKLVLQFKDSSMASFDSFPAQTLNFAPAAIYAQQTDKIGDFGFTNLLRVADSGVPGAATPLTTANYTELVNLITGVSTQYTKAGFAGGAALPAMGSGQVLGWNGTAWQSIDPVSSVQPFAKTVLPSCAAGEYLRSSSGNLVCATPAGGGGGGTVTSVSSANGDISVSTGASTPVLTLNSGSGPNNILKLNPSGQIPAVDGSLITGLSAGSLSTGILPVARGGTGQSVFANYSVIAANSAGNQIGIGGSTANTMLQWQVTGPAWSSATYPATTAANQLLYSSSANNVGGLATANGGVLVTDASGTPSFVSGPVGYVLTSNGGGSAPAWQAATSQWVTNGGSIYYPAGNIGVGVVTPSQKIETDGNVAVANGMGLMSKNLGGSPTKLITMESFDEITVGGNYNNKVHLQVNGTDRLVVGSAVAQFTPSIKVGIGSSTAVPQTYLTVSANNSPLLTANSTTMATFANIDSASTRVVSESYGATPTFAVRRTDGTAASPIALQNNDTIGTFAFDGYNGSTSTISSSFMRAVATETWTPTTVGSALSFATTPNGSSSSTEKMRIDGAGNVGIGTTAPAALLDVKGHVANSGAAATIGTCGTSAALSGNDTRGIVTLGTGSPTSCSISFASAYSSAPFCVITPNGGFAGASVQ